VSSITSEVIGGAHRRTLRPDGGSEPERPAPCSCAAEPRAKVRCSASDRTGQGVDLPRERRRDWKHSSKERSTTRIGRRRSRSATTAARTRGGTPKRSTGEPATGRSSCTRRERLSRDTRRSGVASRSAGRRSCRCPTARRRSGCGGSRSPVAGSLTASMEKSTRVDFRHAKSTRLVPPAFPHRATLLTAPNTDFRIDKR
jgi:hypothetical protein